MLTHSTPNTTFKGARRSAPEGGSCPEAGAVMVLVMIFNYMVMI